MLAKFEKKKKKAIYNCRVVCLGLPMSCQLRLDREGLVGARACATPPKTFLFVFFGTFSANPAALRLDDHQTRLTFRPRRAPCVRACVRYCPTPFNHLFRGETNERGKRRGRGRGRKKIHAEVGSLAMPAAPGVRERLRISFNSAQRLTRAAEESPPPASVVIGGWDATLRAVGLGGGDDSRRFAPLRWLWLCSRSVR